MADDTPEDTPPQEEITFATADRIIAGVLLLGVLALGYVCIDVLAGGAMTRTLTRKGAA